MRIGGLEDLDEKLVRETTDRRATSTPWSKDRHFGGDDGRCPWHVDGGRWDCSGFDRKILGLEMHQSLLPIPSGHDMDSPEDTTSTASR